MRTIPSMRRFGDVHDTVVYDFIDEREHKPRIFYEEVPHIVQYGYTLQDEKKTELGLWRSGKKFNISVKAEDIRGTEFYETWQPLSQHSWKCGRLELNDSRAQLFDWVIHPCLPLIQSLAPVETHWETLQDFLHCPCHELQIVTDRATSQPKVVRKTPILDHMAVHDYQPIQSERLGEMPSDVPRYWAQDIVIDTYDSGDLFRSHNKVRLPDGTLCFFVSGKSAHHYFETGEIRDASLNTIRAFFKMHQASQKGWQYPLALPKLLGIVCDSDAGDNYWSPDTTEVVAGILLTWIPDVRCLKDMGDYSTEQKSEWRQKMLDLVTALHCQGIALGGEDSCDEDAEWNFLNDYTVLIDEQREAWIWVSNPVLANPVPDPVFAKYLKDPENAHEFYDARSFDNAVRMDLKAVRNLFPRSAEESTVDSKL